jgi:hypothetical protein
MSKEDCGMYFTVDSHGNIRRHVAWKQLELPLGAPYAPAGRTIVIRPYDETDDIVTDLDDMDSEVEAVVRD